MFAGRVGPITLVDSLLRKDEFTKPLLMQKEKSSLVDVMKE
ncbi:hypothetical protein [Jeotgalibaca sp. PTS2502]|nr:hypothetical protein [Jeotgalibaca sp. PTS2502]